MQDGTATTTASTMNGGGGGDDDSNKSITYSSTRGSPDQLHQSFRSVVMTGLARDRGLFVPDEIPWVDWHELESWRLLSFADVAVEVIRKFVKEDEVPLDKLRDIVHRSCAAFRSPDVTPLVEVGDHAILELFHGPTFAFKDVALQMLGNFFEYFLETGSNDGRLTILGATSGDTGSAAIYGLRGKRGIDCVILFPKGRVSEIQERQMTTVPEENIHCVAVEGTFDDCQDLVKASFASPDFRDRVQLGAVNSINWCRVLAQTTYYFWSYLRVTDKGDDGDGPPQRVNYSVPTGNFGDVLAGYYAKRMGLPVGSLVVATNENDILHRFFTKGEYHKSPSGVAKTLSPSMDICVSSNFERYLYHLAQDDAQVLGEWMRGFEATGKITLGADWLEKARKDFVSARADTSQTLEVIQRYHKEYNYVLCPHSAVGVSAICQLKLADHFYTVALATAHEAKFPAAVSRALGGDDKLPTPPPQLSCLYEKPTRRTELPNDLKAVQDFVEQAIAERREKKHKTELSLSERLSSQMTLWTRAASVAAAVGLVAFLVQQSRGRK